MVQRALQATTDVMPTKFYLDPDYDLIQFEEGYDKPSREVFYAKYNELLNTHKYEVLREQRNKKLTESDFSMLPDYHLSQENEEEWEVYRQALRDIPSTTEDPETPIWPEPPQVKIVQGKNTRTELSDTKSELKADLQTTRTELAEAKTDLQATRANIETINANVETINSKLRDENALEATNAKLDHLTSQTTLLQNVVFQLTKRIQQLEQA
jgi:hypothetical protein